MGSEPIIYADELARLRPAEPGERSGARLLVETLEALGARRVFGLAGIHVLSVWEELRRSSIRALHLRTELSAGYAADGNARVSGEPTPLLLSSGPGALNALTALMEAAAAHVPVVAIAGQVPREFVGRQRGYLHELPDQIASFRPIVKHAAHVRTVEEIPERIAEAWHVAAAPPSGPVFVEVPTDLLSASAGELGPLPAPPPGPGLPSAELLRAAAARLTQAARPVLWAGGGVARGAAWEPLVALAEKLDAPVTTTFMGRGSISDEHPLAVGAACHERGILDLIAGADMVLAVGTQLGADTTDDHRLELGGELIQIDADPARIGATYESEALVGDCGPVLEALVELTGSPAPGTPARGTGAVEPSAKRVSGGGAERAAAARERVRRRLREVETGPELGMVEAIRAALPTDAVDAWDSTILGYWGAAYFEARLPRRFLYPLGSGTIGYAYAASLGAAAALPELPVLSVCGDGGMQYGIAELASARQHGLASKLVLVDDGGYGILREYQDARFGSRTATDLAQPDFVAVCEAYGMPVRRSSPEAIGSDFEWALEQAGPAAVVLEAELTCYEFDA